MIAGGLSYPPVSLSQGCLRIELFRLSILIVAVISELPVREVGDYGIHFGHVITKHITIPESGDAKPDSERALYPFCGTSALHVEKDRSSINPISRLIKLTALGLARTQTALSPRDLDSSISYLSHCAYSSLSV